MNVVRRRDPVSPHPNFGNPCRRVSSDLSAASLKHIEFSGAGCWLTERRCRAIRGLGDAAMNKLAAMCNVATLALALSSSAAMPCSFDTDCSPGSQCVKPKGFVTGMCTGGHFPGNRNDKKPFHDPFDPNRTAGNTCSFNIDCGPNSHCQMGLGIYGVCVRK